MIDILISGGFDPVHIGHINLFRAAKEFGSVGIALNSDEWLIRKKGYAFMPWDDRAEILREMGMTPVVVDDLDGTVVKAIEFLMPKYFGNGGDRHDGNTPELEVCKRLGVQAIFGLGGAKVQSSSELCALS